VKKVRIYGVLLSLCMVAVLLCISCTPKEEVATTPATTPATTGPVVLKWASDLPSSDPTWTNNILPWTEQVEKVTEGRVTFELYPGESLGGPFDYPDLVLSGIADIAVIYGCWDPQRFPLLSITQVPGLFRDNVGKSFWLGELWERGWFDEELKDFKVLSVHSDGSYRIMTTEKRVACQDDLKGLRLRCIGVWATKAAAALGISAQVVSWGEIFTALQTGVMDGTFFPYYGGKMTGLIEGDVVKYITEGSIIGDCSLLLVMNKDTWAKISPEDQVTLERLGRIYGLHYEWLCEVLSKYSREYAEEHGVEIITITDEEQARWNELISPIKDEWVADIEASGLPGRALMDEALKIRENLGVADFVKFTGE